MKHQVNSHKSAEDCGKGQASIRITADIYGHVSPETNRQAADAMAKALR
jgi:hypothetical protein